MWGTSKPVRPERFIAGDKLTPARKPANLARRPLGHILADLTGDIDILPAMNDGDSYQTLLPLGGFLGWLPNGSHAGPRSPLLKRKFPCAPGYSGYQKNKACQRCLVFATLSFSSRLLTNVLPGRRLWAGTRQHLIVKVRALNVAHKRAQSKLQPHGCAPHIPALKDEVLRSFDKRKRRRALDQLRGRGPVVAALTAMLADTRSQQRLAAAAALGALQSALAIEPLATTLRRDKVAEVRQAAAVALGKLGGQRARECLEMAVRDDDAGVSYCAQASLECLGDRPAVPPPSRGSLIWSMGGSQR